MKMRLLMPKTDHRSCGHRRLSLSFEYLLFSPDFAVNEAFLEVADNVRKSSIYLFFQKSRLHLTLPLRFSVIVIPD